VQFEHLFDSKKFDDAIFNVVMNRKNEFVDMVSLQHDELIADFRILLEERVQACQVYTPVAWRPVSNQSELDAFYINTIQNAPTKQWFPALKSHLEQQAVYYGIQHQDFNTLAHAFISYKLKWQEVQHQDELDTFFDQTVANASSSEWVPNLTEHLRQRAEYYGIADRDDSDYQLLAEDFLLHKDSHPSHSAENFKRIEEMKVLFDQIRQHHQMYQKLEMTMSRLQRTLDDGWFRLASPGAYFIFTYQNHHYVKILSIAQSGE
jgi:hypothetical protein